MAAEFATVDQYLASSPDEVRERLQLFRRITREVVAEAGGRVSCGMRRSAVTPAPAVGPGGRRLPEREEVHPAWPATSCGRSTAG
jgi:hypothetical protein